MKTYLDKKNEVIILGQSICKIYESCQVIKAVSEASLTVERGKCYVIMGPSGSGKSTFLHILGLLEDATSGKVIIDNEDIKKMNDEKKSNIRMNKIGFVFQFFYLFPHLNVLENVIFSMIPNNRIPIIERKKLAMQLLDKVGMLQRENHLPSQLSGGEQQRVAIARALANNPECILADEPTGNVDAENEQQILKIFKELCQEGKAVVIVTHNEEVAKMADEVFDMRNGFLNRRGENHENS